MPPGTKPTIESLASELARLRELVCQAARLRRKEVAARYGFSVRTLERRLKRRAFPRPSLIAGPVWALTDLEAAERDGHLPHPV